MNGLEVSTSGPYFYPYLFLPMHILNLANPAESDIKYKISQFPDGQQNIEILHTSMDALVTIESRFNSFRDLELIICANQALRGVGCRIIYLYIPYILGARSDRKFTEGGTSYLRDVVAPILNAQGFQGITCRDVHSDVAAACINWLMVLDNYGLFRFALEHQTDGMGYWLLSPDAGAKKKVEALARQCGYRSDIIVASKRRNPVTGEITYTEISSAWGDIGDGSIYIVDDICDGGRTFIEIAREIRKTHTNKLYLVVTHGIFSQGFGELQQYFEAIYTTNSIKDFDVAPFVNQLKVI